MKWCQPHCLLLAHHPLLAEWLATRAAPFLVLHPAQTFAPTPSKPDRWYQRWGQKQRCGHCRFTYLNFVFKNKTERLHSHLGEEGVDIPSLTPGYRETVGWLIQYQRRSQEYMHSWKERGYKRYTLATKCIWVYLVTNCCRYSEPIQCVATVLLCLFIDQAVIGLNQIRGMFACTIVLCCSSRENCDYRYKLKLSLSVILITTN